MNSHSGASLKLPDELLHYVRSPGETWPKIRAWLNARWQLRACQAVGSWPRVTGRLHVRNDGEIVLGERVQIFAHFGRSTVLATLPGGRIEIGDRAMLNYGADISATKLVKIGADSFIGTHAIILDNDFHEVGDHLTMPEGRPVIIGDRAWLGNRVLVLPGVTIGDGAVIGAGSLVKSDIPPRSVAAGVPARIIKAI